MTEDDFDTIDDIRAALAACAPSGPDGDVSRLVATAAAFVDLLKRNPGAGHLIERLNGDLRAVGYELRKSPKH